MGLVSSRYDSFVARILAKEWRKTGMSLALWRRDERLNKLGNRLSFRAPFYAPVPKTNFRASSAETGA